MKINIIFVFLMIHRCGKDKPIPVDFLKYNSQTQEFCLLDGSKFRKILVKESIIKLEKGQFCFKWKEKYGKKMEFYLEDTPIPIYVFPGDTSEFNFEIPRK